MKFEAPKNQSSIIKVLGVGGGGSNAVTYMYRQGIRGVDFILANTDSQALEISEVPVKIQLGANLTEGMGAGSIPEVGRQAAIESSEELREMLSHNTKMLFITAGMGGGTGTGAAPVIASIAKELGILTVGIVTIPFLFEGRKRKQQADQGIAEMRKYVDTLLIICNDKLRELFGDLKLSEAFGRADDILTIAAKGIAEIITVTGNVNVDFNDVNTVMRNSGAAIMGTGVAEGENRARVAVEKALNSPLLNESNITGAKNVLLYIASGSEEISMDEITEITDYIQAEAGSTAEVIWGSGRDETLGENICVTIIATGFNSISNVVAGPAVVTEKTILPLEPETPKKETISNTVEENKMNDFEVYTRDEKTPVNEIKQTPKSISEDDFIVKTEEVNGITIEFKTLKPEDERKEIPVVPAVEDSKPITKIDIPVEKPQEYQSAEEREMFLRQQDRTKKLRELSIKLRTQPGLEEVEKIPAYKRRNVELSDVKPSSESEISRFMLGEDDEKKTELKSNSFLHDNVD
jgi:cell division protein FtsZ